MKRKLTTIMVADAVGYSALMARDEARTLDALHRARGAMEMLFARHDGREINTWGDAIIAEFDSVVAAVQCAVEIQNELSGHDDAGRLAFRIGINLGDVIVDGDDLIGDGVNIAARLQEIAPPGGIVISGPVYEQVRQKLAVGFDLVGPREMKNIAEPVSVWRVRVGGANHPSGMAPDAITVVSDPPHGADAPSPEIGGDSPWRAAAAWFASRPRWIKTCVVMIGLFFFINMAANPFVIWFHWPSIPFALAIILHLIQTEGRPKRP